jgi:hypothetical protein
MTNTISMLFRCVHSNFRLKEAFQNVCIVIANPDFSFDTRVYRDEAISNYLFNLNLRLLRPLINGLAMTLCNGREIVALMHVCKVVTLKKNYL